MASFVIDGLSGKKTLSGTVSVSGAKNSVLPTMAAALLIKGETVIENVPDIADVGVLSRIIEKLGGFVTRGKGRLTVQAHDVTTGVIDHALAKTLRASIVLTGPLLARLGSVSFPHPGGDLIGERPIDLFLAGFQAMGATVSETGETYTLSAPHGLQGADYFFSTVSVTGTETLMMAAVLAKGTVVLRNAAMEPEVIALAAFLNSCGARVEGAGTPVIVIKPVSLVEPAPYTVIPDRIEAATFLALGAIASKDLTVSNVRPHELDAVLDVLTRMQVPMTISDTWVKVSAPETLRPVRVRTHEYPGFPTDAHPPVMVLLTQAAGESVMIESIFDGRLKYTEELVKMGADISMVSPHRARVVGQTPLRGADITTPDIRAGLAFMLAAIIADGRSTIGNAELIDRGYERIEERLSAVGVSISRKS